MVSLSVDEKDKQMVERMGVKKVGEMVAGWAAQLVATDVKLVA